MALQLYLLRHGQTIFSRDNMFCGSGVEAELTAEGAAMAEEFAAAYVKTVWQGVYVSPQKRAMLTARPLVAANGLTPQVRDGLREIGYGEWEGKTVEQVEKQYHDEHIRWTADPAWNPPTGGETATAIATRGLAVIEEIRRNHADGNVLLVSHKATIRILLCALLGIDVGRFRYRFSCPVCALSVVEFGSHGPLLKTLADRSHLSERLRSLPGT